MTPPKPAWSFRESTHRYELDGESVPSVTTVLSAVISKDALAPAATKFTAEWLAENIGAVIETFLNDGRDAGIKLVKGQCASDWRRKADLGTAVHQACEHYARGVEWTCAPEAEPYLARFAEWCERAQPTFHAVEALVFSRKWRYAGKLDCIAEVDGKHWCVDLKSGSGIYADQLALQLAAYRYAEFIGDPVQRVELPLPQIDGCAVLHLSPTGWDFQEVTADEATHRAYLYGLALYHFLADAKKNALVGPVLPLEAAPRLRVVEQVPASVSAALRVE